MENTINSLKVYMAYFKIKFLNEIQYKVAAIAGALTQFAWGFMYIMLYTAFLKEGTSDYSISQMSTYIWLNQAFFALFNNLIYLKLFIFSILFFLPIIILPSFSTT